MPAIKRRIIEDNLALLEPFRVGLLQSFHVMPAPARASRLARSAAETRDDGVIAIGFPGPCYRKARDHGNGAMRCACAIRAKFGPTTDCPNYPTADKVTVTKIVTENIARESRLHTDESRLYVGADAHFEAHKTVHHTSKEYARRDFEADADATQWQETVHTNSAEGYFSIFKRGMRGVYQHCAEKHLHRYLAEYDFRYNHRVKLGYNDGDRAALAVKSAAGKRLTYRGRH
jgi:hypothetical protein